MERSPNRVFGNPVVNVHTHMNDAKVPINKGARATWNPGLSKPITLFVFSEYIANLLLKWSEFQTLEEGKGSRLHTIFMNSPLNVWGKMPNSFEML